MFLQFLATRELSTKGRERSRSSRLPLEFASPIDVATRLAPSRPTRAIFTRGTLQPDHPRLLESIAKTGLRVSSSVLPLPPIDPPPFCSSFAATHFRRLKAGVLPYLAPCLGRIIQSTFSSHDDRISLSPGGHVYRPTVLRRPISISIPVGLGGRAPRVQKVLSPLIIAKGSSCFDVRERGIIYRRYCMLCRDTITDLARLAVNYSIMHWRWHSAAVLQDRTYRLSYPEYHPFWDACLFFL